MNNHHITLNTHLIKIEDKKHYDKTIHQNKKKQITTKKEKTTKKKKPYFILEVIRHSQ
jgi:hypothetical protein